MRDSSIPVAEAVLATTAADTALLMLVLLLLLLLLLLLVASSAANADAAVNLLRRSCIFAAGFNRIYIIYIYI